MSSDELARAAVDENEAKAAKVSPPVPNQAKQRGGLARFWQWFWHADSMRELQRAMPEGRGRLLRNARATAEVARRVEESPEPFEYRVDSILCDLYRQSIRWSLRALDSEALPAEAPAGPARVPAELLSKLVPDAETRRQIEAALDKGSFESFEELPERESAALISALRQVAVSLIGELETDKRAIEALWAQRFLRLGLVFGLLGAVVLLTMKLLDGAEQKRDLAAGAPWRVSSVYGGAAGCRSPQQECNESPEFFFHTEEEQSPWIEFDLGSAQQISGARVDNRKDCCVDRAAPMVIEVSSDQTHWQRVARREATFTSWSARFAPVRARWVRFRLEQRNPLHLQRVRILR